ncbi:MAG: hypothetical protein CMM87_01730 [Rickettsiales bacterium]|nr:hypothetical protein [Rickettsiales bacterium]|tara:strand:+ start:22470 stop:23036 length:567 start_codon:yes stop_codon:yes gene_type:complete
MRLTVSVLCLGLSFGLSATKINVSHDVKVLTSGTPFPSGNKTYAVLNYEKVKKCFDKNVTGLRKVIEESINKIGGKSAYAIKWATGLGQNYENLSKMGLQTAFDYEKYLNISFQQGSEFSEDPKDLVARTDSGKMPRVKVNKDAFYVTYTGVNLSIPLIGGYTFSSSPKVLNCPIEIVETAVVCRAKQ